MKHKKTIAAVAGGVAVVGLLAGFMGGGPGSGSAGSRPDGAPVRTVTLEQGDIRSTVSATGTVYSVNAVNVYSNLNYPVQTVHVSVGDVVEEGQVLAELDSASLKSDISQKEAQVYASQSTAQLNLKTAQQDLNNYQQSLKDSRDSSLLAAEKAVVTAESNLAAAKLEVQSANADLSNARRDYREAQNGEDSDGNSLDYSDAQVRDLRTTVSQKEIALEKAQNTLAQREADLESAKIDLEVAQTNSGNTLKSYQDKVTSAQLNNNYTADYLSIEKLQTDLENCTVTAPVSGTITEVNAIVGGSGNGLLFVIQNTEDLKVVTNIKEYDIGAVNLGDAVIIKADATGDTEFVGELSKLSPTSTLTASGGKASSTDAEFEAEIAVSTGSDRLLIGMNARLSIVTDEKTGVFSVPFEAVETVGGQSCIYVEETGGDGSVTYRKIPVKTGLETNLYVEIDGEGLEEGMQVVKSASGVNQSQVAASDAPGAGPKPEGGAA
ncbi:HlyD family secretion protein [Ruminococcaceae bacterium OttesenSCG-928-L11]|nr:HlyD family secretion protein [Ruminococcaceae bacterium OttesenSCG-928-L11]